MVAAVDWVRGLPLRGRSKGGGTELGREGVREAQGSMTGWRAVGRVAGNRSRGVGRVPES